MAVLLALAALLAGAGGADRVGAQSPAGLQSDFLLASFEDKYGSRYRITAWSGPSGEEARGRARLSVIPFRGRVACLAVHHNEALVIADLRAGYAILTAIVRDTRSGADELVLVDVRQGRPPRRCPSFDGTDAPGEAVTGDINVHDS